MPIPIKIQCQCGQRYAFDVETAGSLSPNSVACPMCGADGTAAANWVIMQSLVSAPAAPTPPPQSSGLRLAVSAPSAEAVRATSRVASQMLQVDPDKARSEARAKMIWGDSPESVTSFLRMQGFRKEEASALVRELVKERKLAVRRIGFRKIVTGISLMTVPIITLVIFLSIGVILMKVMAVAVMVGLWGVWLLINGIIMFLAPKSQPGDLANQ